MPRARIRVTFGALMLVMLLASLDQTIVSTALPTIVQEFGGLEHLSWVVTAYLLSSTVVGPLYGKLGDLYGRKIVLQSAVVLFLIGSALCGMADSMPALIAFRAIQGLGGGGLMVTTLATVGDIVPPRERGRYQGLFGAVFGTSTVIGPLVGGFFVEHLSWRWIFYVNLPLGLIAIAVIAAVFSSPRVRERRQVDYLGTVLLTAALSAIILVTSLGGTTFPWRSPTIIAMEAAALVLLVGFVLVERRAPEPIMPLSLFRNDIFVVASGLGLIVGFALFGSVTFMPLFLQVVKGESPAASGLQLAPMMAGTLITSIITGRLISRFGRYKPFPIVGSAITTAALFLLSRLDVDSSVWTASSYMLLLGLGLGMIMQVPVLAVQNAVDYRFLGVATSGTVLFRSIGGSLGVALYGTIFASRLRAELLLHPDAHAQAYAAALHPVFEVAAAMAAAGLVLACLLREAPLRNSIAADGVADSFAMPRDATSLRELERIVTALALRENRWRVYERLAQRAGLALDPTSTWLLIRLGEGTLPAEIPADALMRHGLAMPSDGTLQLTDEGRRAVERLIEARRAGLSELLAGWAPEQHADVRALLDRLARTLASEMPPPRDVRRAA